MALGRATSCFTSGSSLNDGGWYGLLVSFSSDVGGTALKAEWVRQTVKLWRSVLKLMSLESCEVPLELPLGSRPPE